MNIIAKMWLFAELCSHDKQDSGDHDSDPHDYIKDWIANLFNNHKDYLYFQMSNSSDFAYILELQDMILFVFRGTYGDVAWINNFSFFPLVNGYIHKGFFESFEFFRPEIDKYLKSSQTIFGKIFTSVNKPVFCIGHSRGGILSQLCARHLAKNRHLPVYCINFGSPVGGTKKFRDEMNLLPIYNTRVVNGYDLVTRVFDDTLGRHAGNRFWLPQPKWHMLFTWRKLMDHAYSSYTHALIKYSKKIKDQEAVDVLNEVKKRVNI